MNTLDKGLLLKSVGFGSGFLCLITSLLSYKLFDLGNIEAGFIGCVILIPLFVATYKLSKQGNRLYKKGLEERKI